MRSLSLAAVGLASILYLYKMEVGVIPTIIWTTFLLILIVITPNDN